MAELPAPTLYSCAGSRGLRASWAAEEAGVALDLRMLPFPPRFECPEYLDLNPLGTVPLLVDGDSRMTESCAIAHYLAVRGGADRLVVGPAEPDYAAYLDFTYHADATLTFPQTVYLRFARFEKGKGLEEAGLAYARWFGARLAKVDERLAAGDFLCANRFTVADICVGYALYLARRIGLEDQLTPRLVTYLDQLTKRSGFIAALAREEDASRAAGLGGAVI